MMVQGEQKLLVTGLNEDPLIDPRLLARVAQKAGRSPMSISFEILRRRFSRQNLRPIEYITYGLWRKEMDATTKDRYLSQENSRTLNRSLSSPGNENHKRAFADKFLSGLLFSGLGLPVPENRAVYSPNVGYGPLPVLRDAVALAAFMLDPGNHPFFGKPVGGSRSIGALSVLSRAGDGKVLLGDGREVSAMALAQEIAGAFPRGWLIQELLRPAETVLGLSGPALGTVRIVTFWGNTPVPQVLYGFWRLPATGSMTDGIVGGKNVACALDTQTGAVTRARLGDYMTGKALTHALADPSRPLIGFQIPDWNPLLVRLCDAHQAFPGHGILGWDVALTMRGHVVTEVNTNPMHTSFQRAVDAPFLTPERKALLDDVPVGVKSRRDSAEARR